jgi:hypothetical protein
MQLPILSTQPCKERLHTAKLLLCAVQLLLERPDPLLYKQGVTYHLLLFNAS